MSVTGIIVRADVGTTEDFIDLVSTCLAVWSDFEKRKLFAYFNGIANGLAPDAIEQEVTEQAAATAKETTP